MAFAGPILIATKEWLPYSMLAFVTIVLLYGVIGVMAAKGTIGVFRKMLAPKSEQFFYAIFLILIAALSWLLWPTSIWRRRGGWKRLWYSRLPRSLC